MTFNRELAAREHIDRFLNFRQQVETLRPNLRCAAIEGETNETQDDRVTLADRLSDGVENLVWNTIQAIDILR